MNICSNLPAISASYDGHQREGEYSASRRVKMKTQKKDMVAMFGIIPDDLPEQNVEAIKETMIRKMRKQFYGKMFLILHRSLVGWNNDDFIRSQKTVVVKMRRARRKPKPQTIFSKKSARFFR